MYRAATLERFRYLRQTYDDMLYYRSLPFPKRRSRPAGTSAAWHRPDGYVRLAHSPLSQPRVSHRALVDACASWWTQGAGHGNPGMALAIAEAAGRYGHVIFAGNIHAPALEVITY